MVTRRRTRVTPTWRSTYFRICVLLLVSIILEVVLIGVLGVAGFGRAGLVLSLLIYLSSVVLSIRMMLDEYNRSQGDLERYRNRRVYFSIDMIAYATGSLGVVMRAAARDDHIYEQVGLALEAATTLLLAGSLIWASLDYSRTRDKFMFILAFTLGWLSLMGSLALLLMPPASSSR